MRLIKILVPKILPSATVLFVCSAIALIAGCQTYRAQPLDKPAIEKELAEPPMQSLRVRSAEIHHPLLPSVELQPELGLTPDEAAIVAVLINPSLRAARDQRATAEAALLQAGLLPNPQFSYNYDWTTGGNTFSTVNAYGWGLSYDITSLIAHDANVKSARANAASVDLTVAWQEWQTAEAAKMAVYDLLSLQAQLAMAEEIDSRLQENFALMRRAEAEHLKLSIDLASAEAAARDSHSIVLNSKRDVEHQRLQLNRALGIPASTQVRLRSNQVLLNSFEVPNDSDLLEGLENRRLDLLALQHGYDSQEEALRAAVLNQFPRINLGFNRASDNTNVHSAGLGVTIDLPIFDRNQGAIATQKATRQRLFDEYVGRVFDARADIASASADLRAINEQITDAQAAVPNLQRLVDVYKQALDRGHADAFAYYLAWSNLAQKNLAVLKLQQQLADNRVALELAAGYYFPQSLVTTHPSTQPLTTGNTANNIAVNQP